MTIQIDNSLQRVSAKQAAAFVQSLADAAQTDKGTFDSVAGGEFLTDSLSRNDVKVPENFQVVLDEADPAERSKISKAILDSVSTYNQAHGTAVPSDVLDLALHNAYAVTDQALMDSATNYHHDQLSLQPNRAVVAIIATISEAIPFAHYLPADIRSNEARLAILTHRAGSDLGSYKKGDLLDGINSGNPYLTSARVNTGKPETGENKVKGKITMVQKTYDTCDSGGEVVKLLRGRTQVYVEGIPAAREAENNLSGTGNSPISGTVTIKDKTYAISGHINTDDGTYELTSTPDLPKEIEVTVEAFVDYEKIETDKIPHVDVSADVFKLYAKSWRGVTRNTIDSRTQLSNELGLDPLSESIYSFQVQLANERHYDALRKGLRIARNNAETFDWGEARKWHDSARAEVWRDLAFPLGVVSQRMAEETFDHGVTHLYVGKNVKAQLETMPNDCWVHSGLTERPGIYRLGRLFGRYEVYYLPKLLEDDTDSSQILCVGRGTDVCRNPMVLGDAVPPIILPLAVNADLRQGAGFYCRNFTEVNPWIPASKGFGLINVINMAGKD